MTTLDDDFIRLELSVGTQNILCKNMGVEWPPPLTIEIGPEGNTETMYLISNSELSDEASAASPNVARGALYRYDPIPVPTSNGDDAMILDSFCDGCEIWHQDIGSGVDCVDVRVALDLHVMSPKVWPYPNQLRLVNGETHCDNRKPTT